VEISPPRSRRYGQHGTIALIAFIGVSISHVKQSSITAIAHNIMFAFNFAFGPLPAGAFRHQSTVIREFSSWTADLGSFRTTLTP
jgi:hypothetical protein